MNSGSYKQRSTHISEIKEGAPEKAAMKYFFYRAAAAGLFILMLICPKAVFTGASEGLLLWFRTVLPTLFPFLLISELLITGGGLDLLTKITGKPLKKIFRVSENGSFAVLAGFLCGCPMGAKAAADLVKSGRISLGEGKYLLSFCNNISPVFILNFVVWKTLDNEKLAVPTLGILFLVPFLLSLVFRRIYVREIPGQKPVPQTYAGSGSVSFESFDSCMMDSFESITRIGGYIIVFSVLISVIQSCFRGICPEQLLPFLELTNGVVMIGQSPADLTVRYPTIVGLCAFGGFCSAAQTDCMIRDTGLSVYPYIIQKLAAGLAASLLAYIYCLVAEL